MSLPGDPPRPVPFKPPPPLFGEGMCVAAVKGPFEDTPRACGEEGVLETRCPTCRMRAWACSSAHMEAAERTIAGHILGRHPETLKRAVIDAIRADPEQVAAFRAHEREHPGAYAKLLRMLGRAERT